jgi:molybdopterin converting factor small subunit
VGPLKIIINYHTILQKVTSNGLRKTAILSSPEGLTINDLLSQLELEIAGDSLIVVVNHHICDGTYLLKNGDQVDLIPALSGG